jgi:transcriptional regulator with XRE-family HTH domain
MLRNIKIRCAELDFSQRKLARSADISESLLSEVIRGRHEASLNVRKPISVVLRAPEEFLFSTESVSAQV